MLDTIGQFRVLGYLLVIMDGFIIWFGVRHAEDVTNGEEFVLD